MKKTTARVLITKNCQRNCYYCCNEYESIKKQMKPIYSLWHLRNYEVICITGGEPLLNPERTIRIIQDIKKINPKAIIYLYTALFLFPPKKIIPVLYEVDGIHFTLHEESRLEDFYKLEVMQEYLALTKQYLNKSLRLYINQKIYRDVKIKPYIWKKVEVKPWLTEEEGPLPDHEVLFIFDRYMYPEV